MWAVFRKDVQLELRNRYAVNTLFMFVAAAGLLTAFGVRNSTLDAQVQATLLWIVILFAASIGLGRAFVAEEEQDTRPLLQLHARPGMVYAGKLLYNFLLTLAVNLAAMLLFIVLLDIGVAAPGLLITTLLLGALGLAGATTLLAAIIARASAAGLLLPVLLFPLLIPLLISVVEASRSALVLGTWTSAANEIVTLIAFAGVTISASVLLFDYVWND